jgi:hypothetical protein
MSRVIISMIVQNPVSGLFAVFHILIAAFPLTLIVFYHLRIDYFVEKPMFVFVFSLEECDLISIAGLFRTTVALLCSA